MTSNITYEEALSRCSSALRCKLEHSVQLIRKAERLAMNYDPDDGYFLAFSGGKDSQALYHVAVLGGIKFKAHMNLTSVDPPEVIRFVKKQYPDVALTKPKDSIYNIAVKMGILPTMRTRWCCQEFKEMAGAGKVTLIGIRKQESTRRAKRKEVEISNHKFQGTLEQLDDYREEQNEKRRKKRSQKRDGVNITNATDEKTLGCIRGKESLLISPIIDWTESDVWEFLNNVVCVPHCELYDQGWHRIGCINCPMASHKQKLIENERWPHVKRNWIKTITRIRCGGRQTAKQATRRTSGGQPAAQRKYGGTKWRTRFGPTFYSENSLWGGQKRQHPNIGLARQEQPTRKSSASSVNGGFSESSSSVGLTEEQEQEIAENIYDWWISGKGYKKWYADKFLQMKFDFDYGE